MSQTRTVTLKCSGCGAPNDFTVYDSVNVSIDHELKKKVLDGSIFKMHCKKCEASIVVKYDLLYHDMSEFRPLLIQCFQEKNGWEKVNSANAKIRKMMREMNRTEQFPHRVVIGYNSLRETIRIFDSGYDDRIMFVAKRVFATLLKRDGVPCTGIQFCSRDENRSPIFSVLDNENQEKFYSLPFETYDNIAEKLLRILPEDDGEFILIDDSFMEPYLKKI